MLLMQAADIVSHNKFINNFPIAYQYNLQVARLSVSDLKTKANQ